MSDSLRWGTPTGLNGERGLLVAIIARATQDFLRGPVPLVADSYDYFTGPAYQDHLAWLELPQDYLPAAFLNHDAG